MNFSIEDLKKAKELMCILDELNDKEAVHSGPYIVTGKQIGRAHV